MTVLLDEGVLRNYGVRQVSVYLSYTCGRGTYWGRGIRYVRRPLRHYRLIGYFPVGRRHVAVW